MKILVFHQPFPMGNYRLNEMIAQKLQSFGHEVYLLQQLNGAPSSVDYIEALKNENFDIIYYEMLDAETFKVIEQLKSSLRILLVASRGIFKDFTDIIQYKGKYFDKILTNSDLLHKEFLKNNIESQLFNFYLCAIDPKECFIKQEYLYDNVFLGMGFARQNDPEYVIEQRIFFNSHKNFNFGIFGNGWMHKDYKGLLPPNDIGSLYSSAKSASAIIGSGQRSMGMINNRYTEIAFCKCPLISYNYDIDWKGSDKYINFIQSEEELNFIVSDIKNNKDKYLEKTEEFYKFILSQDKIFYDKLLFLLK